LIQNLPSPVRHIESKARGRLDVQLVLLGSGLEIIEPGGIGIGQLGQATVPF
jgi:hypothetical protein